MKDATETLIETAPVATTTEQTTPITPKAGRQRPAKTKFQDCMIREVRINYQATTQPTFRVSHPEGVASFVRSILCDNSREHVIALFLDGAHQVASYSIVSIGTANMAPLHPREIFQRAISAGAVALVLAHNHPSENIQPSADDEAVTKRIKEAGALLGISLLDHVIVTNAAYYSFKERGAL